MEGKVMVVATNNKGKLEEIKKIFSSYEIYSLKDKGINIDVVEDGDNFLDNALKKAKEIYNITKEEVIADDSGLCINALDGFPGVNTHRFLGDNASDLDRNEYLINEVNKFNDRNCRFICVVVYYNGIDFIVGEGVINGFIAKEIRGTNGFGFYPIFELDNGKTLAELSSSDKNKISARYLALMDLKGKIDKYEI